MVTHYEDWMQAAMMNAVQADFAALQHQNYMLLQGEDEGTRVPDDDDVLSLGIVSDSETEWSSML